MMSRTTRGMLRAILGIGFLLLVGQAPADAKGPKLIHTESVGEITITSFAFGGPPGCDPVTGAGCTFYDLGASVKGQHTPFGPYTETATATVLLAASPNGGHDANGSPTEYCMQELGTAIDTYSDGSTISSDFQGTSCCATASCSGGPPRVNHDSSVITGGTKKFSGAEGGWSWSDSLGPSGALLLHAEGVLQLPSGSETH
jgi:hypothetical protein